MRDTEEETPMWQPHNVTLHGKKKRGRGAQHAARLLTLPFVKKYIHYVKHRVQPVLTPEAAEFISASYAELRSNDTAGREGQDQSLPVTARTLETMIRLSTAHAKARQSETVDMEDATVAMDLLNFSLFAVRKEEAEPEDGDESNDDDDDDDDDNNADAETPRHKRKRARRDDGAEETEEDGDADRSAPKDEFDFPDSPSAAEKRSSSAGDRQKQQQRQRQRRQQESAGSGGDMDDRRMEQFMEAVGDAFKEPALEGNGGVSQVDLEKAVHEVTSLKSVRAFSRAEFAKGIEAMQAASHIMLANDQVYLI